MTSPRRGTHVRIGSIRKTYGSVTAVNDISLEIEPGAFVTLLGPSGSGKTTLLMMLGGFVQPTAGDIFFDARTVVRLPPHKRNIGMVFQNYALFPHMSVAENIGFPLRLRRRPREEIARRVSQALELVQLAGYERRRTTELSGGQSQRVALARALVFEPDILLMDEPLSALDKKLREQMQVEIRRIHDDLGVTTVYVTHDQREALTMSDRIAVIDGGRLMQYDAPRTLYSQPQSAFVAGFIGESVFLPVARDGGRLIVEGRALGVTRSPPATGDICLVLRPEKLRIVPGTQDDAQTNFLIGTYRRAVFQGDSVLHTVALASGAEVLVRDLAGFNEISLAPGAPVTIAFHHDDALVVSATG